MAEELVKKPLSAAAHTAAVQVHTLAEKHREEFSTLPRDMDIEEEREGAESLFLHDRLFKMSDPMTEETRHASPWMPVSATLGRERIFFTAKAAGDNNSEVVIEDTPLLLINWIECGCLTKLLKSPSKWKVVAESGQNSMDKIQKIIALHQEDKTNDQAGQKEWNGSVNKWRKVWIDFML